MKKIDALRTLIESTNGKIAYITFTKKDGTVRNMNCRIGVVAGVNPDARTCMNGTTNTTAHLDYILTVYDMTKRAHRNINLNTITHFKCGEIVADFK